MSKTDTQFMEMAMTAARSAADAGEVPVGAVLVSPTNDVLAMAGNSVESDDDPTSHAEMRVIRLAAKTLRSPRLIDCALFVTLEPCAMCAQAISLARIKRLVFAAYDPKGGGVEHGARVFSHPTCHHRPDVIGGLMESDAGALLKDFFANKR